MEASGNSTIGLFANSEEWSYVSNILSAKSEFPNTRFAQQINSFCLMRRGLGTEAMPHQAFLSRRTSLTSAQSISPRTECALDMEYKD